ncbi:uroporphyrinogen decarboxylase [Enterovirga rhinocerotis]|uniref:uroporphyrinogen decarboxylase n=1 Tax=Enterovirga rhinocerotis TaxID=1339210 RepID=UPI00105B245F|nr:uroporphyrinogen decarboxylase [Enterovirga rhinocerotis]
MADNPRGDEARTILRVLGGEAVWPPPVWVMRQAGRYLPEYLATRAEAGSFTKLCYTPALATEVTLQPIRRYGFDGAILFSDILVVPDALGAEFRLDAGEGPRLRPVTNRAELDALAPGLPLERLAPVLDAVRRIRAALPAETTLLGFCGAPWTVAAYMVAGRGTPEQRPALDAAERDPGFMRALIDLLVRSSVDYLCAQIEAGADAVQIFESHGGALPDQLVEPLSLGPIAAIVAGVRTRHPGARIIVFPRGRADRLADYAATGASCIGIDQHTDLARAVAALPPGVASQGNLDPEVLLAGGEALDRAVDAVLDAARGRPHVFNLGHGIIKETPVENVARMIARVRAA